jgi:hypothetical protein
VSLWGLVQEHTDGWRAALAYPERLFVWRAASGCNAGNESKARHLAEGLAGYGVPVEILSGTYAELSASIGELTPLARR